MDVQLADELKRRTKQFGLRVVRLYRSLPRSAEAQVIGRQLLRSATSVGANYRAVCRARSDADFAAKLAIFIEEADESLYWLEMLVEAQILPLKRLSGLMAEGEELVKIFVSPRQTVRRRENDSKFKIQNSRLRED
jgi:four helix bundle protein